jgi:hypothetical protein
MNAQHIELKLTLVKTLFEEVSDRIDALKPGERLPLTNYSKSIASKYGLSGPQLYPIMLLLTKDYPGTKTRHGKNGGLVKMGPGADLLEGEAVNE